MSDKLQFVDFPGSGKFRKLLSVSNSQVLKGDLPPPVIPKFSDSCSPPSVSMGECGKLKFVGHRIPKSKRPRNARPFSLSLVTCHA